MVCALYTHLFSAASKPYLEMLNKWITFGVLKDPFNQFFISRRRQLDSGFLNKDHSDSYWDSHFAVVESAIPSFIGKELGKRILQTGKYWNVLRECKSQVTSPSSALEFPKLDHYVNQSFQLSNSALFEILSFDFQLKERLRYN